MIESASRSMTLLYPFDWRELPASPELARSVCSNATVPDRALNAADPRAFA
jgi:hypothetical protein